MTVLAICIAVPSLGIKINNILCSFFYTPKTYSCRCNMGSFCFSLFISNIQLRHFFHGVIDSMCFCNISEC